MLNGQRRKGKHGSYLTRATCGPEGVRSAGRTAVEDRTNEKMGWRGDAGWTWQVVTRDRRLSSRWMRDGCLTCVKLRMIQLHTGKNVAEIRLDMHQGRQQTRHQTRKGGPPGPGSHVVVPCRSVGALLQCGSCTADVVDIVSTRLACLIDETKQWRVHV